MEEEKRTARSVSGRKPINSAQRGLRDSGAGARKSAELGTSFRSCSDLDFSSQVRTWTLEKHQKKSLKDRSGACKQALQQQLRPFRRRDLPKNKSNQKKGSASGPAMLIREKQDEK